MQLVENLKWRYATKKMDASRKVSQEHLEYIKEAIQLSPSSYGLQAFKVLNISNPELRESLKPKSWGQSQITDASNLFLFCNYINVSDEDIDNFVALKSEVTGVEIANLSGYGNFVKAKMKEQSAEEMINWTSKQSYIALANAMTACAELQIDCTPIEGFEPGAYNEILGLTEKGLSAAVVLAIGYRHSEDAAQHDKKVRKPFKELFEEV
jgi:nitroreductase/dihydropteridine reductase